MKRGLALVAVMLMALGGYSVWQYTRLPISEPLEPLTIALSLTPLSAPIIVAKEQGLFEKYGIDMTLKPVHGGVKSFQILAKGEADLATTSETVAMFNSFERNDFNILASFVESDNDVKLWSIKRAIGGSLPDALKGGRIGIVASSASEYFFDSLLQLHNIPRETIEKIDYLPEALPEALLNGDVDAIAIWEPYGYQLLKRAAEPVQSLNSKGLHSLSFLLVSGRLLVNKQHQDMQRVIRALDEAVSLIHQQPDLAKAQVSAYLSMSDDKLSWLWQDYLFRLSLNDSLLLRLKNQARWAQRAGLVEGPTPSYRHLLNPGPLVEATQKVSLLE
ncbi:ABC transporter substrate-binding protein [Salinivibrio sp. ES.052]|uniref:ABC transporter substrate-binding protein n=1 Tax=Salinivibrio sp. ES.052 TaxID=1882823 RepID=UPI000925894C|nr:ABC transporter substrate-binding protein [Salinivibrio sp. ES.052]SIO05532.1 ABC-type nitrate/sulfonate/bicarbonate transport system, substrate-binding protein [Salinivibrio sp. ES.052]